MCFWYFQQNNIILYWTVFYLAPATCQFPPALFHLQNPAEFRCSVDAVFVRDKQTERIAITFSKYGEIQLGISSRSAWILTHGVAAQRCALRLLLSRDVA